MLPLIVASKNEGIKELLDQEGDLVSKSQWIIGGDGWAYDIGCLLYTSILIKCQYLSF